MQGSHNYGASALLFLFYPLAGYLADVRWGRHKTVVNGLSFILCGMLMVIFLAGLATIASIPILIQDPGYSSLSTIQEVATIVLCVVFGLPVLFALMLTLCSLVAFNANVIQFGSTCTMLPQTNLCCTFIGMCGLSMLVCFSSDYRLQTLLVLQ